MTDSKLDRTAIADEIAACLLQADGILRTTLLKVFGPKVFKNPHRYKRAPAKDRGASN